MIKLEDFKLPDGKYDLENYEKERVRVGEKCSLCGNIMFRAAGVPIICSSCTNFATDIEEVADNHKIRCPRCGAVDSAYNLDGDELYNEGTNDVTCPTCGCEFTIETSVSFTFTSPPRHELTKQEKPS